MIRAPEQLWRGQAGLVLHHPSGRQVKSRLHKVQQSSNRNHYNMVIL